MPAPVVLGLGGPEWSRPFDDVIEIDLTSSNITDAGLEVIGTFPKLRELDLDRSKAITDAGLREVAAP